MIGARILGISILFNQESRGITAMHVVIFELQPKPEGVDEYLDLAAALKSDLEKIEGFISIERFQSMTIDGKILSLSFWQTEDAIADWRKQVKHREAQSRGYIKLFENYRLRVAEVKRDYTMTDREQAPQLPPGIVS